MTVLHPTAFVVGFDSFVLGAVLVTGDGFRDWLWWLVVALNVLTVALAARWFLNEDADPGSSRTGVTTQADGPRHESR